jgi:hypothetical protein
LGFSWGKPWTFEKSKGAYQLANHGANSISSFLLGLQYNVENTNLKWTMFISYTNTKVESPRWDFFKETSQLVDVLTSTSSKVIKICKEHRLCPFMESPCEKEILNTTLSQICHLQISRENGIYPQQRCQNVIAQIVLNDKSPNPQGETQGKLVGQSPFLFTLGWLSSSSRGYS